MADNRIIIKNPKVLRALLMHRYDLRLVEVIVWIAENYPMVLTEGWRIARHGADLHATDPVRAIDIRSWIYENPVGIAQVINQKFVYDPNRPDMDVAVLHAVEGGVMHFHLQAHQNTRRR